MKRIKQALRDWIFRPAHFWQFWRPQSGFWGGALWAMVMIDLILWGHAFYATH